MEYQFNININLKYITVVLINKTIIHIIVYNKKQNKDIPLGDFLVLVSGLHLLVNRRVFSHEVSLFAFKLSTLVIS